MDIKMGDVLIFLGVAGFVAVLIFGMSNLGKQAGKDKDRRNTSIQECITRNNATDWCLEQFNK